MPSIERAMAQSLHRRSVLDLLAEVVQPLVFRRDTASTVEGKITDVKTAFSSWDNCMKAAYCKWPVVALIIIGGLIVLSVVWCAARCLCCGLSCCCECFYCCKCCGDCCGCCDPPHKKPPKYLDEPFVPPNQGYRSEERMLAEPSGYRAPSTAPPPIKPTPQFASFDVSGTKKPVGEDSLPEMPTWENAMHTKVPIAEEDPVELDSLQKPNAAQAVPLMSGGGSGSPSRQPSPGNMGVQTGVQNAQPYGAPAANGMNAAAASTGYLGAAGVTAGPGRYGQNEQSYSDYGSQGYNNVRQNSSNYGSYDDYGNQGYSAGVTGGSYDDYRHGGSGVYGSGSIAAGPYGSGTAARSASNIRAMNNRAPPVRQYASMSSNNGSNANANPHDGNASPTNLQNNGGFDFSSGFSRPPTSDGYGNHSNNNSQPNFGYDRTTSPAPVGHSQSPQPSYPGYRPYQPTGSSNF